MKKLALMLLVVFLAGCQDYRLVDFKNSFAQELPDNSTNIKDEGPEWISFQWKGQCFLFGSGGTGNGHYTSIVKIDCPAK